MRLATCVPALAVLLSLTACDGPTALQMALKPASALEIELVPEVDSLLPGDELTITIVVRNPTSAPIEYAARGAWPWGSTGVEVVAPDGDLIPTRPLDPNERGRLVVWETSSYSVVVAPRDSIVRTVIWQGLEGTAYARPPLPSGTYRLRPFLDTGSGEYYGPSVPVRVLPWTFARFVHTEPGLPALAFDVGPRNVAWRVTPGYYTPEVVVGAGMQHVEARPVGEDRVLASGEVEFREGVLHTVALGSGPAGPVPWDVTDTAITPASTESRLRVVHLAAEAPTLEVFVTRPSSPDPGPATPVAYGSATPYVSSFGGGWRVTVTTPGGTDTLLSTAAIQIEAGEVRTLVLMDGGIGAVSWVLLDP
jgi:hypothetical protein